MPDKTPQKQLLRDRGICVVIPTYNNGGTVADVVRRALAECADVIVVDDGSTDDTASQLLLLSPPLESSGEAVLTIVTHDRNRGKGRALQTGFRKAIELGFSYVITLDADGQHYPEDIPKFLEANRQHPGALIIGSRHIVGNASKRCDSPIVGEASKRCDPPIVGEASKRCDPPVVGEASKLYDSPIVGEASKRCDRPVVGEASKLCDRPIVGEASKLCDRPAVGEASKLCDSPIVGEASKLCDPPVVGDASKLCDRPLVGEAPKRCGNQDSGSRFANKFSNFWFYVQTGHRIPDTQTGYRLYPLTSHLSFLTSRYEAELELLVFASWHGVELVPIDIDVYYPPAEERVTHFRPAKDFARISLLNTVLCFLAVVYGLPLRLWRWLAKYVRTIGSLLFFVFFSVFVFTPAVWLYVKFGPMSERKRYNIHRLLQWLSRFVMIRLGIPGAPFSIGVVGDALVGNASKRCNSVTECKAWTQYFNTPHVIISNHQSHLDLMCLMVFSPRMVFLTNDWVWRNPFYGFIIRQAEYYPVSEGIDTLMPRLRSLVERGYSIAVFPEGTRSPDCRIARFHQGAFHIAQQLGIGILPACLYGPGKVLPKKSYTLHKSPIHIEVAQPITRDELEAMGDTMEQAKTLRRHYIKWYDELCNRMEK